MAFVFKAPRRTLTPQSNIVPGPGDYINLPEQVSSQNRVPFLTKVSRMPKAFQPMDHSDTRLYNLAKLALISERSSQNKLSPGKNTQPPSEPKKRSTCFGAKAERFSKSPIGNHLGPGYYGWDKSLDKKVHVPVLGVEKVVKDKPLRTLPRNRSVPSIPSRGQSHGYTEAYDGNLVLNEQPIEDPVEYPSMKNYQKRDNSSRIKPDSWSMAPPKNLESYIPKSATLDSVGPGSYRALEKDPAHSNKPSWGFTSRTGRTSGIRIKRSSSLQRHNYQPSIDNISVIGGGDEDNYDEEEDEEYAKEATPGPGYYHNESTASSFLGRTSSLKSRRSAQETNGNSMDNSVKPYVFGGVTERFKDLYPMNNELGPGDYNPEDKQTRRVEIKFRTVPFQSGDVRFEKKKIEEIPGPGAYQIKLKLGKDIKVKSKMNVHPNNFATITQKLNKAKLKADIESPGPGDYDPKTLNEIGKNPIEEKKGLAVFVSKTKRQPLIQDSGNPAVGLYNLNQCDIATKIIKDDDDLTELVPKRVPFNSSIPRFDNKKIEEDLYEEEEGNEDEVNWINKKALTRPFRHVEDLKPHAVFSSQTKRAIENRNKVIVPGPGAYSGANAKQWEKTSFNVHFNSFKES